jgi:hypothetical protein
MSSHPTSDCLPKRHRGGQPGNQNAKGNRGNTRPRSSFRARRGGAPLGNKNACKRRTLASELLREYAHVPEARAWVEAHLVSLRAVNAQGEEQRDRPLHDGWLGLTPEALVERGDEFRLGLYVLPEGRDDPDELAA